MMRKQNSSMMKKYLINTCVKKNLNCRSKADSRTEDFSDVLCSRKCPIEEEKQPKTSEVQRYSSFAKASTEYKTSNTVYWEKLK